MQTEQKKRNSVHEDYQHNERLEFASQEDENDYYESIISKPSQEVASHLVSCIKEDGIEEDDPAEILKRIHDVVNISVIFQYIESDDIATILQL